MFGLADEAWQIARDDLKKRLGGGGSNEEEEMMEICEAVCTALEEDAGGFGTAGFHLVSCLLITLFVDDVIILVDCFSMIFLTFEIFYVCYAFVSPRLN